VRDSEAQYSAAETERMMKLQDVLLKAMAKKIRWWDAAEIIGVTDRTMRQWRERLEAEGYSGLVDRRKGRPSDKRVPLATVEEVLRLYREKYFDLNIRHFHEKLREEHGMDEVGPSWVGGHRALCVSSQAHKAHRFSCLSCRACRIDQGKQGCFSDPGLWAETKRPPGTAIRPYRAE